MYVIVARPAVELIIAPEGTMPVVSAFISRPLPDRPLPDRPLPDRPLPDRPLVMLRPLIIDRPLVVESASSVDAVGVVPVSSAAAWQPPHAAASARAASQLVFWARSFICTVRPFRQPGRLGESRGLC